MDSEDNLIYKKDSSSDPEYENINENITDSEDDDIINDPKNIYTLNNPSESTLEYMQNVRRMPFHKRIFRKFQEGSLRGTIITWVRMTLGIGIFAIPHYIKNFGLVMGFVILVVAALFNYLTFRLIFEVGTFSNKTTYIGNV